MAQALDDAQADWVPLAGYIHPALLPKFGGRGFYGRLGARGRACIRRSGNRRHVHLVDEHYDAGPILAQVRVPVCADDDAEALEERVKVAERKLVIATLAELAASRAAAGY